MTAKEFSRLPPEEQRKRYMELANREAAIYRMGYEPIIGKKIKSETPPVKYTPEEREKHDREMFACLRHFHQVPDDLAFEDWIKTIEDVD